MNNPTIDKNIFVPLSNWFKLKDTSFSSSKSLTSLIPKNPLIFDPEDTQEPYLIISSSLQSGEVGSVSSSDDKVNLGEGESSKNSWVVKNYSQPTIMVEKFIDYVKAKKNYQVLSELNKISDIKNPGIYYFNPANPTDFVIKEGEDPVSDFVLVFADNVNLIIKSRNFNINEADGTVKKSVAFIVNKLEFNEEEIDSSYQKVGGIFIAKQAKIKANLPVKEDDKPLKIKGNLIAKTLINERFLLSPLKPSLFVVFDVNQYMNLFPYLSISNYDWKQLQ